MHGGQRDLQRGRQARQDQAQHRHVVDERTAEIARGKALQKGEVLPPQRLVEAIGTNRLLANLLRGVGRDHHVDRVAHRIDADEHQRRNHQHHHEGLQQALDDEGEHGI